MKVEEEELRTEVQKFRKDSYLYFECSYVLLLLE